MKILILLLVSSLLIACGPSKEEKQRIALEQQRIEEARLRIEEEAKEKLAIENSARIAAVTCSILKETRNMDSAIRVEKMNEARQKLGAPPFLDGDNEIKRSVQWGTCELLVIDSEDYEPTTLKVMSAYREQERIDAERRAKEEQIAAKKRAEQERVAAKKKAEAEKIAQEKLDFVLAKWETAAREEVSAWKVERSELSIYLEDENVFFEYLFLNKGNLISSTEIHGEVVIEFNDPNLPKFLSGPNVVGDNRIASLCIAVTTSECLTSLNTPKTTSVIKKKFSDIFGIGEFNRVYPPKDSYKAYFQVTGISLLYGETSDFHQEFYPELKQQHSFEKKYEFINPIKLDLE